MALRSNGPLAGFGWLMRAIHLGRGNPKAVFGGAGLMIAAMLLPMCITLPMQMGAMENGQLPPTMFFATMAISAVFGLLLLPAYGGYLRVVDAVERGQPARAADVFGPYRQGEILRFIGYGLAMFVVYLALLALVLMTVGAGVSRWYMAVLAAGGQPAAAPPLPPGFGITVVMLGAAVLLLIGIYSISLGQVALRGRSVVGAIGDGVVGSLKNLLPLLMFAVSLVVAWLVFMVCFALVVFLLAMLGKLVGVWLMFVVLVPAYIVLLLVMMVVMFGAMYHLWRDVCDDAPTAPDMGHAIAA